MIELVLMFIILPKTIYPLALSKGRCPVLWTLSAGITWMLVEMLIVWIYVAPFLFLMIQLGKLKEAQIYLSNPKVIQQAIWATSLVYFLALLSGIFSSILVKRYLSRQSVIPLQTPPLPFEF
jgi:hypothetical protein